MIDFLNELGNFKQKKFTFQNVKFFYNLKQQTHINFLVPTTKVIKIKNHPLYPKCVSLFFVGPIFCNLASLGDNFQKLNIINFLYWFWTFKMMEHHRKFNFQNYLSKYFSKNWFCIPSSSNFTRLALNRPLHAPFHFTRLTFWS